MYKYKNETDNEQDIVGVGVVKAGAEFQTNVKIENPNFTLIEGDTPAPVESDTQTNTEVTN